MIASPEDYFAKVSGFDKYIEDVKPTVYFLGLSGEIGELVEAIADVNGIDDNEIQWQEKVLDEIGDVFWYWFALTNNLKLDYKKIWNNTLAEYKELHYTDDAIILNVVASSGRLLEHLKKSIRDDGGKITETRLIKIEEKLTETLSNIFGFCRNNMRRDPYVILQRNYNKLSARNKAGTLHGEGEGITKEERS